MRRTLEGQEPDMATGPAETEGEFIADVTFYVVLHSDRWRVLHKRSFSAPFRDVAHALQAAIKTAQHCGLERGRGSVILVERGERTEVWRFGRDTFPPDMAEVIARIG